MSEPPLKRKRTILDFFSCTGKKQKMSTRSDDKNKAEAVGNVTEDKGSKEMEPKPSTSNQKPVVNKNEKPKLVQDSNGKPDEGSKKEITEHLEPTQEMNTSHLEPTQEMNISQDLFDDSQDSYDKVIPDIPTKKPKQISPDHRAGKGTPLKTLTKIEDSLGDLGTLQPTENHVVTFRTPFSYKSDSKKPPQPYNKYKDRWDNDHVRMPCSNSSEYPVHGKHGAHSVRRRWDIIEETLLEDIPGPYELEETILLYNTRYFDKWSFSVLHQLFVDEFQEEERFAFFGHTLKKIKGLALQLPNLCSCPIPMLKKGQNRSVTLSQQQIACLLANAFLCTFPRRNSRQKSSEYYNYPSINFNTLFMGQPTKAKLEKMKCIIHYFTRIVHNMPTGTVTFTRQSVAKMPNWDEMDATLRGLYVSSEGTIEDDGDGFLQVDFANKVIGGGVLGHGCVQEEIRFLICPEMIVSRLFTETLEKNECLIMTGCERFSDYDGYASTFQWKGNHVDKTARDGWGRLCCEVVAIDALVISDHRSQFSGGIVKRELNKAYCGFINKNKHYSVLPAVCTGNWGCGAFGGDKSLKGLIQLMAASAAGRDVCYFTFEDKKVRDDMFRAHKILVGENMLSIGDIMQLIEQYRKNMLGFNKGKPKMNLFEYIVKTLEGTIVDTDSSSNQSTESLEIQRQKQQDEQIAASMSSADWEEDVQHLKKQTSLDYKANTP